MTSQNMVANIRAELAANADPQAKASLDRVFKENVISHGMKTAVANQIAKRYIAQAKKDGLSKSEIYAICNELWASGYQEEAMVACLFSESQRKAYASEDLLVFEGWLNDYVDNWAKCDTLCNHTVGDLLMVYPELAEHLLVWATSENRWVKRAAAVSLIVPARKGYFLPLVFQIADILLVDPDDLVQKGYGWMLKAAAEAHQQEVFDYVMSNKACMPRTALRYAIEKMPAELKAAAMAR
ncbi:MAG: DNA alkylation repair protein [Coriobacteriales bacterium]|jgi:3-methyladenine DNA glycosylase AlkD|nr:DNA alkylation repair protein [Coriobacteriales bacterium]